MAREQFLNLFCELVELPPNSLTGEEKLDDLDGWSSIAMLGFIALVDEHFGKSFSIRSFRSCETVNDLAKLVGTEAATMA